MAGQKRNAELGRNPVNVLLHCIARLGSLASEIGYPQDLIRLLGTGHKQTFSQHTPYRWGVTNSGRTHGVTAK